MDRVDVTIIGGGVIGLATAYVVQRQHPQKEVVVLEKNKSPGEEQSGRSSGVIHAGYSYIPGTRKAELCPRGNRMTKEFCAAHDVPCVPAPKYVLARNEEEKTQLKFYHQRARQNKVEAELIDEAELRRREPNIRGLAALCTPQTAVIDAGAYLKTLEQLARKEGAHILTQTKVSSLQPLGNKFRIGVESVNEKYSFESHLIINAAGLYADEIARMVSPDFPYTIVPFRGEYLKFNSHARPELALQGSNIYPLPHPLPGMVDRDGHPRLHLGIHLTPTFEYAVDGSARLGRTYIVGPLSREVKSKSDYETERQPPSAFLPAARDLLPGLAEQDLTLDYAGIQVKIRERDDFVLPEDPRCSGLLHVIADSPGLSCALPLAERVLHLLHNKI